MLQPRDTRGITKQANKLAPQTAGKQWFDLPAQQLTDETRRDLKLLQLRGTFDPKRFYKSSDHKKGLPKFFQIGKVVEASADFYSGTKLFVHMWSVHCLVHVHVTYHAACLLRVEPLLPQVEMASQDDRFTFSSGDHCKLVLVFYFVSSMAPVLTIVSCFSHCTRRLATKYRLQQAEGSCSEGPIH